MRIEEILNEEYEDISLDLKDGGGRLMTNLNEPANYLYRIVTKEEHDDIMQSGVIKPSQFYGRIHASVIPVGGDAGAYTTLKIKYEPSDGWKTKVSRDGAVYAVTSKEVPSNRIVDKIPMVVVRTNSMMKKTRMSQYMEYQT